MAERLVSIIAAMDEKRGIGKEGKIPWKIPGEQRHFREVTDGSPVIMGRRTHESLKGRVLPGRLNIVVTKDLDYKGADDVVIVHSLEEGLERAEVESTKEIFVIGGREIYAQALPKVKRLYLTLIEGNFGADVLFPEYTGFNNLVSEEEMEVSDGNRLFRYKNIVLERD